MTRYDLGLPPALLTDSVCASSHERNEALHRPTLESNSSNASARLSTKSVNQLIASPGCGRNEVGRYVSSCPPGRAGTGAWKLRPMTVDVDAVASGFDAGIHFGE
jgi:hypothetical protein